MTLESPVNQLNKVGRTIGARLKKLGIETVKDLIFYYPFRYEDFSKIVPIKDLEPGITATVRGKIEILKNRRTPRRKKIITEAVVSDQSDSLRVVWFNQPWIAKNLRPGTEVYLSGKTAGNLFDLYLNSPSYERATKISTHTARLVPIYSLTEGLSQKQLRFLVRTALKFSSQLQDYLPEKIRKKYSLNNLLTAVKEIHFPENYQSLAAARQRLAFDELFLVQLWSQILKKKKEARPAFSLKFCREKTKKFVAGFGFSLTDDQKKSAWEIIKDLKESRPMTRLLEGDVGSGKTAVAAIAIVQAVGNGFQAVFMAPTEILARQHFETLTKLADKGVSKDFVFGLLTREQRLVSPAGGKKKKISKKDFLAAGRRGEISVVVGTHALIQKEVFFKRLGLVIIDEQHRFGVKQRELLSRGGGFQSEKTPHLLSLTATPIPRSLALTLYGSLDLSVIRQLPPGRKKVITRLVSDGKRQAAYNFIAEEVGRGGQVFVVCPLIDPSDKLGVRSVNQEFEKLNREVFPNLSVGILHGRLKSSEKEKVVSDFSQGKLAILISTSVVEVGVDIPNASVMVIEGAERFGLAQLHQFRGRVGRSSRQSYCFLFSDSFEEAVRKRLEIFCRCHDGLTLARRDLELRGAGQIYGYQQSGFNNFKLADLTDAAMINQTQEAAKELAAEDSLENYPVLQERLAAADFAGHQE